MSFADISYLDYASVQKVRIFDAKYCRLILSDHLSSVGMGKTIMISSLIHTNRGPDVTAGLLSANAQPSKSRQLKLDSAFRAQSRSSAAKPSKGPCATLIVAPTSLLNQWAEELERCSKQSSIKTLVWHGQNRVDLEAVIEAEDEGLVNVVITSYGVLASEHAKVDKSGKLTSPIYKGLLFHFLVQLTNDMFTHLNPPVA